MKYETIQEWRDTLAKITTERLSDYNVKSLDTSNGRIEIYLPTQEERDWPFMRVELTPAGEIKRNRIRIYRHFHKKRDYETDEPYVRNISRVVAAFHAEYEKEIADQKVREERQKAEAERAAMLEELACEEMKKAFASHKLEYCRAAGANNGGKVEIGFPKAKDETGFSWSRYLALDYMADDNARLSWSIGNGAGAQIPNLAAFAKTIC